MLVLALDTTTRAGSVALARDGILVDAFAGDASRTHAARLPGDILTLIGRHGVGLGDIDLFGVAAGPGSFTGLRIGIATIQGLAFANEKPVVAVSALQALAHSVERATRESSSKEAELGGAQEDGADEPHEPGLLGAWIDAQRGEVFAELFDAPRLDILDVARVDAPAAVIEAWTRHLSDDAGGNLLLVGDGATRYRASIEARLPHARVAAEVPTLAPAIARLALLAAERGEAGPPHAVRPLYVRRPDAELARERRQRPTGGSALPAAPLAPGRRDG